MDRLTPAQGRAALLLARAAVEAAVEARAPPVGEGLDVARGAFVTLRHRADLRGCIGAIEPRVPLHALIPDIARSAALEDPRFDPVGEDELAEIDVEVSVLTPPRPVAGDILAAIRLGETGLIAEAGRRRGLLLPQVATEHALTPESFASLACRKAGLAQDAWRTPGAVGWLTFEAQVFSEEARYPRGIGPPPRT